MSTGQGLRTESFLQVVLAISLIRGIIGVQKEKTSAALMALDEDSKFSPFSLDIHLLTWYNTRMEKSITSIAMDLSNGSFAHHCFGVMNAVSEGFGSCPHSDEVATDYLNTFHAGWDQEDEEPSEDWDDESAFASAGHGMDESYAHGEDFGYFGEAGLWD